MTTQDYKTRVRAIDAQGATRSDAQAIVDAENMRNESQSLPVCRYCGEESAGGSFRGLAHKWGPTKHKFTARKS